MIRWLTELKMDLKFYLYANQTWKGADQEHKIQNEQMQFVWKQFVVTRICLLTRLHYYFVEYAVFVKHIIYE